MNNPDYALFPLPSVVFPDGLLALRIFEPRYLDMVSMCMKGHTGFGVCAGRPNPLGGFSKPRAVGTLVEIVDFDRLEDGALGIRVKGRRRFHVIDTRQADNGLWWGSVEFVSEGRDMDCPGEFQELKQITAALIDETELPYEPANIAYDSACWLSGRLTELLPFDADTKHDLLATDDPLERLQRIRPMVNIERR